ESSSTKIASQAKPASAASSFCTRSATLPRSLNVGITTDSSGAKASLRERADSAWRWGNAAICDMSVATHKSGLAKMVVADDLGGRKDGSAGLSQLLAKPVVFRRIRGPEDVFSPWIMHRGSLSSRAHRTRCAGELQVSETESGFKPKKSVALSGVVAGNTALSTVGRSGNDLHYRGYDILDIAERCEFEEIAHLLVHERLPNAAELAAYKAKLRAFRGIPASIKAALETLPASAHPMDVMRTAVSALGCVAPEKEDHNPAGARDIADRLMASLGSMLLYWHHFANNGKRIDV